MSKKPEPRPFRPAVKSAFTESRPSVPPAPVAESSEATVAAEKAEASAQLSGGPTGGGGAESASRKPKKKKQNFYQAPEDTERADAAWRHTMGHTGIRTWTGFVEEAVREFTHSLEQKYNDSRPFS